MPFKDFMSASKLLTNIGLATSQQVAIYAMGNKLAKTFGCREEWLKIGTNMLFIQTNKLFVWTNWHSLGQTSYLFGRIRIRLDE